MTTGDMIYYLAIMLLGSITVAAVAIAIFAWTH